jgi:hypothetical protein
VRLAIARRDQVAVRAEQCETCIFRPGNLMALRPGRVAGMIASCEDDAVIKCHHHLPYGDRPLEGGAVGVLCRGMDQTRPRQTILQIASRLDHRLVYVDDRGRVVASALPR